MLSICSVVLYNISHTQGFFRLGCVITFTQIRLCSWECGFSVCVCCVWQLGAGMSHLKAAKYCRQMKRSWLKPILKFKDKLGDLVQNHQPSSACFHPQSQTCTVHILVFWFNFQLCCFTLTGGLFQRKYKHVKKIHCCLSLFL